MNAVAFVNLPQLVFISLNYNDCISQKFEIEGGLNELRRSLSRSCASADVVKKPLSCIHSVACDQWRDELEEDFLPKNSSCCELEFGTHIEAHDYTFMVDMKNVAVELLVISHQLEVDFLPVSVHESFPDLKFYSVRYTPVKKISKKNFEKMSELKLLILDHNQIEVIKSNTFEDLISLELIFISTRLNSFYNYF